MIYEATKRHEGNLNAYCWVKEANLERLQTIWFQLCDTWTSQNYGHSKKSVVARDKGVRGRGKWSSGRFQDSEAILRDAVRNVITRLPKLRLHNTKSEFHCKL